VVLGNGLEYCVFKELKAAFAKIRGSIRELYAARGRLWEDG